MSAEMTLENLEPIGVEVIRGRRILRFATGVTLAMALATAIAWPLSFLTAVLVGLLLGSPVALTLRAGLAFVLVIAIAMAASLLLSVAFLPYPPVFFGLIGLLLFRIFYTASGGGNPLFVLWMIVGLLVIPLMTMSAPIAGALIAVYITFGAAVAVGIVWLMQTLIPHPRTDATIATSSAKPEIPEPPARFRSAAISTLAVMPLMVVFYVFQLSQHIVVLIYAAILAISASSVAGLKGGSALIAANIGGGVLALVIYNLLVAVPDLVFFVVLIFLTTLFIGQQRFSDRPNAALYGSALNTVLIVIGSVTTSTAEADAKVYLRIAQIILAVIYIVAAFGLLEGLWRRRSS
jgi:hypothetical protein